MDDLKKMRGFPNMNWMVRSAMRMTARPSGLIHANEIVLKNGPTQISLEKQTGNILYIENVKTGHVYSKTEVPGATAGSKSGVEIKSQQEAKSTNPPFTLFLFWRHFGPNHLGCILHCDQITFKTKIKKDKENHVLHLTWDISHLGLIQWGYIQNEFACNNSGGFYIEKTDDSTSFIASESEQIPTAIDFSENDFLRIRTSIRINDEGYIYFGDFHIKRITEDGEKANDENFHFGVYGLEYPIVRGVRDIDPHYPNKNFLVYPHQEGKLLRNPHERLTTNDQAGEKVTTLRMTYPNGYDGTMQFMALFSETKKTGLYFATHDDSMKEKTFIWTAAGGDDNPYYNFSMIHWSDDVCADYIHRHRIIDDFRKASNSQETIPLPIPTNAGTARLKAILDRQTEGLSPSSEPIFHEYDEYIPVWKDYRQDDYWLLWREFRKTRDIISWYDAADIYKSWARNPNGPVWASKPRIYRESETEKFYREIGYAVGFLGAEFALARENSNYLRTFHNILYSPTPELKSRVLFIMGWDWHYPFGVRYNDGYQFGNKPEYWKARFGPENNVLLNYNEIKKNGDLIVPYIFAMKMVWGPADNADPNVVKKNWPGWLKKQSDDPGSPWVNKRMVPDNWAKLYHYFLCPSTTAYRRFVAHRDSFTRGGNYDSSQIGPLSKPLDGVYHDIGVTFLGGKCFHCDRPEILLYNSTLPSEKRITLDELHDHFTAEANNGFQVGSGGFINRAKRIVLLENMYGTSTPSRNAQRKGLFCTEAMTEIFLDAVDCYGMAVTWGPYKQYTYASQENSYNGGGFGGDGFWIFNGTCKEIPMLQYIYNPVMPIRISGPGNFSGGIGPNGDELSAHDMGKCYYWLVAKSYLSGFFICLNYDLVPMDLLTGMNKKADTYMLDWNRPMENPEIPLKIPETLPPGITDYHYWSPNPGRHPYNSPLNPERRKAFNEHQRTYSDPQKEIFLRMMAYLRTQVAPEFLVYGEMMRPGKIVSEENIKIPFRYEYYWSFGASNHKIMGLNKPNDVYAAQLEHDGDWKTKPIITSAWHEANPNNLQAINQVQLPNALYIIANTSGKARFMKYSFQCDLYPSDAAIRISVLRMRPELKYQSSWNEWQTLPDILQPTQGIVAWEKAGKLFPHEILLIKLEPSGKKGK